METEILAIQTIIKDHCHQVSFLQVIQQLWKYHHLFFVWLTRLIWYGTYRINYETSSICINNIHITLIKYKYI